MLLWCIHRRNSNQRCYVVHLTDNLTLEENVAYDSFGHCFFIEDGAETGNTFRENLGSGIKIMDTSRVALLEASSLAARCELLMQLMQFFGRGDGTEEITTFQ